jgi:hypothetical protein
MEAFSSQGDGTLTVIKENSPTDFSVEQTVPTPARAKTLTLDSKTNQIFTITAEYGPVPAAKPDQPSETPGQPASAPTQPPSAGAPPAQPAPPAGSPPPAGMPAWMRGPRPPMIPGSFQILVIGK